MEKEKTVTNESEEIFEIPINTTLTRRRFMHLMGSGVAVFLTASDLFASTRLGEELLPADDSIAAWIYIDEKSVITVFTGKVEVGQNIRTSLTQVVAEELRVSADAITMIMGDTNLTPYDRGTFGSLTTPTMSPQLRKAAASLREEVIEMAATLWKTSASLLKMQDGKILHPGGNTI
jgi:nicotinate dehydrogenase subunit B